MSEPEKKDGIFKRMMKKRKDTKAYKDLVSALDGKGSLYDVDLDGATNTMDTMLENVTRDVDKSMSQIENENYKDAKKTADKLSRHIAEAKETGEYRRVNKPTKEEDEKDLMTYMYSKTNDIPIPEQCKAGAERALKIIEKQIMLHKKYIDACKRFHKIEVGEENPGEKVNNYLKEQLDAIKNGKVGAIKPYNELIAKEYEKQNHKDDIEK